MSTVDRSCPGINDGGHWTERLRSGEAGRTSPIAVVPVGLTCYRDGNKLFRFCPTIAPVPVKCLILYDEAERMDQALWVTTLFAADEFYIRAERLIPTASAL